MKIIFFLFLLLFNFSTYVISCPSSGDGDCVPSTEITDTSNQTNSHVSGINTSSSYEIEESDGGLPDDYIVKPSSYLKKINEKSKLSSKIERLNFDLDGIIYNSSNQYNSNFSGQINDKLFEINRIMVENKNIDRNIFNPLHQNINKLLNSIIGSFNDDKSLKFQNYKIDNSDIFYQIKKYNEINDIVKTLEVMN
ncbi:MAG: hypothetical protein EVA21_03820 [Alphaproteobacteria bacterium]|nr:MAG: hypothetical protein EVA21_03820 [Alphaproteobacteria bacterium]